jgi:predicted ATPase/DNA-binding SARP family transcriptional activator
MGTVNGVQFRLLGPLEVRRDGEPIGLAGERQRALLAVLLVHANEVVSIERLIEQLFGGERSDSAVKAVRVAVSRLRRLLDAAGEGVVVETLPGAYRLRVEPERVDAAVFERLLGEGRRLLKAGDPLGASAPLYDALGLWRGAPLADTGLVDDVLREIRRLEEQRLLAVLERIDADLALGAAAELIAEIEALISAEPLQERLRGQLMRALYRAGRQTDALAVYREFSGLLRDELGLEPSPALKDLERMVLEHDHSLMPDVTAEVTVGDMRPGNLSGAATSFLGRGREVVEVGALLGRDATRLVTLIGAGGSGKTRLAQRVAELSTQDEAWFVAFSDVTDPDLILTTICTALGLTGEAETTAIERLRGWGEDREALLVLDNMEQLAAGSAVLGELLASCPRMTLLVTSRGPLRLAGEQQYEVRALGLVDAIQLFTERAHAVAPCLMVESEIAGQICERLDRLPLAIELAAARVRTLPPREILARLAQHLPVLAAGPRDAPRRQRTLTAAIEWGYELLTKPEQRLFLRLAVFAGDWTLAAAETVCEADLDMLQGLADRGLITVEDGRYSMLHTHREYALGKLLASEELDDVRRRHAQRCTERPATRAILGGWGYTRREGRGSGAGDGPAVVAGRAWRADLWWIGRS